MAAIFLMINKIKFSARRPARFVCGVFHAISAKRNIDIIFLLNIFFLTKK